MLCIFLKSQVPLYDEWVQESLLPPLSGSSRLSHPDSLLIKVTSRKWGLGGRERKGGSREIEPLAQSSSEALFCFGLKIFYVWCKNEEQSVFSLCLLVFRNYNKEPYVRWLQMLCCVYSFSPGCSLPRGTQIKWLMQLSCPSECSWHLSL